MVRGGQVSGIAGGSYQFSARVSGLVKKPLDCAVRTFMIPISPGTRSPVKLTVRTYDSELLYSAKKVLHRWVFG